MPSQFKSHGTYVLSGRHGEIGRYKNLAEAKRAAAGDAPCGLRWKRRAFSYDGVTFTVEYNSDGNL